MTTTMQNETGLRQFATLFVSRRDDFAVQQDTGRYVRHGRPLTWDTLRGHLNGEWTLGTYVIDEHGLCRFAVFDADSEDGLTVLLDVQGQLATDGIPSYLEASRRGGHLWVLFDGRYPASLVRRWLLPYSPAGVEFYPKQDEGGGYGSLIRLPFGVHRRSGCWYPFVVWDGDEETLLPVAETVDAMLEWLAIGDKAMLPDWVRSAPQAAALAPARATPRTHTPIVSHTPAADATTFPYTSIQQWCSAHDPFAVIGRYVALDVRGLGCCPFTDHHRHGVDRHPSFRVYAPRSATGSCWYCYTADEGGTLFDFLLRYHGLDARTLWHRLRAGELP